MDDLSPIQPAIVRIPGVDELPGCLSGPEIAQSDRSEAVA